MLRQRTSKNPASRTDPIISADGTASSLGNNPEHGKGNMAATEESRQPLLGPKNAKNTNNTQPLSGRHPNSKSDTVKNSEHEMENLSRKSQWIVLALASGGCAAFNGVFAKLTTTELTTTFATWVANLFGMGNVEGGVEVVVRAIFFGLNLIFNGIMWTLFTKALARGTSTTQVSILNTSANFMCTAVLGALIFSESLHPLWFVGAALLVAGNVIIGRREEGEDNGNPTTRDEHTRAEDGEGIYSEEEGLLTEEVELDDDLELERKKRQDEDDILQLDLEEQNERGRSGNRS